MTERDLAAEPIPHIDRGFAAASLRPEADRGDADRLALTLSEALIGELEAADALLISTPMHNFAAPSALKAWLDHVMRPGRTFRGTPAGKVGLLPNRPSFLVVTCGGRLGGEVGAQADFLGPYLAYALGAIGLVGLEILRLTELERGPEMEREAFGRAEAWIDRQSKVFELSRKSWR